jgi:23S rRNA maturation mini-RNase III
MSDLTGPIGLAPTPDNMTDGSWEAAQAAKQKEEEENLRKTEAAKLNTPTSVNPIQGLLDMGDGDVGRGIKSVLDVAINPVSAATAKIGEVTGNKGIEDFSNEVTRVSQNTIVGGVEQILNTGDLVGDLAKTGLQKLFLQETEETENPFSDRYTAANYSFGLEKPKTVVGQMVSSIGQFLVLGKLAALRAPVFLTKLAQGGKLARAGAAAVNSIIPGAVADFMLTANNDENLSSLAAKFVPVDHPAHKLFVLAIKEDDPFIVKKLKATVEGSGVNAIVDGLGAMIFARKVAQAAQAAGDTPEVAAVKGIKAMDDALKDADKANAKDVAAEAKQWSEVHKARFDDLQEQKARLDEEEAQILANKGYPDPFDVDDADPEIAAINAKRANIEAEELALDERVNLPYDPDDVVNYSQADATATTKADDINEIISGQFKGRNNSYSTRSAGNALTDSGVASLNLDALTEAQLRQIMKRADLQKIAKDLRVNTDDVIKDASTAFEAILRAGGLDMEPGELDKLLKATGVKDPNYIDGSMLSAKGIVVTKALLVSNANKMTELAETIIAKRAAGEPTGNLVERAVDRMVLLLTAHKKMAYQTGFNLQMFAYSLIGKVPKSTDYTKSVAKINDWAKKVKLLERSGSPEAESELMQLMHMMMLSQGDVTKQMSFATAAYQIGTGQAIKGFYNSVLSGPITHARNLLGNSISLGLRPLTEFMGAIGPGEANKAVRAGTVAGLTTMSRGIGEAWSIAMKTWNTGIASNIDHRFVTDDIEAKALLDTMERMAKTPGEKIASGILHANYNFLNNPWINWPQRALLSSDDFFKQMAARYKVGSKAMHDAVIDSADDVDVDSLFKKYTEKFEGGFDKITGEIKDPDLLQYANRITFQQDPGSVINSISNAVDQTGIVGKLFLPFIRTPANIFGYSVDHMPIIGGMVNKMNGTLQAAIDAGDHALIAEIKGRQAVGTMALMGMVTIIMNTDVTGNMPHDAASRDAWRAENRPPYSIKIGGVWVSYLGIEPFTSMLSLVADAGRLAKMGVAEGASQALSQLGYSMSAAFTDRSMLSGFTDIAALLEPDGQDDQISKFALSRANSMLPSSGARRAFANSLAPYTNELRGEVDRMLVSAVPGLASELPIQTNPISGEKIYSNAGGLFNANSPIRIHKATTNKTVKALTDMGISPMGLLKTGRNGVKLNPQQREELAQLLAKSNMSKDIDRLISSKGFQALRASHSGGAVSLSTFADDEDKPPYVQEILEITRAYKNRALDVLSRTNPDYNRALMAAKLTRLNNQKGIRGVVDPNSDFLKFSNP